jgi:signal transduction histidine kinase
MAELLGIDDYLPALREELRADIVMVLMPASASPGARMAAGDGPLLPASWQREEPLSVSPRSTLSRTPVVQRDLVLRALLGTEQVALGSALVIPLSFGGGRGWFVAGVGAATSPLSAYVPPARADELQRILEIGRLRREIGVYREVRRAASRLARVLTLGGGLEAILHTAVTTARELVGTDAAYISLPRTAEDELFHMVAFANVRTAAFRDLHVRYGEGLGGLARARRKPVLVLDYGADRRLKNAPVTETLREGFQVAASTPLLADRDVTGCLYVANRHGRRLSEEDVELLRLYAAHVADSVGSVAERESVQALVRQQEREQLAYQLHDTVLRSMLEIAFEAETARGANGDQSAALATIAQSAHETLELLRTTLSRESSSDSQPRLLSDVASTLRAAKQLRPMHREVRLAGEDRRLGRNIAQAIFAVAHEALVNAELHSGADSVKVVMQADRDEVTLVVHDSGHGFARSDVARPHHFGLAGMHRRVAEVDGRLWFEKPHTGGFAVHVSVPIDR